MNPMETELAPTGSAPVRYTVRVPANATERSYHCAVGFTTQPTAEQVTRMGLRTAVRVVAAFYVVVGRPRAEGALKRMRLEYVPHPPTPAWRDVVVMENSGLMYYRPS